METIIGLLFILLPVILKAIGKKLENAASHGTPGTSGTPGAPDIPYIPGMSGRLEELFGEEEPSEPVYTMPEEAVPMRPMPKRTEPAHPKPKAPILQEDTAGAEKEKIDLKKMVIYSEIMKPKYDE